MLRVLEEGASHQLAGLQWCRFLIGGDDILPLEHLILSVLLSPSGRVGSSQKPLPQFSLWLPEPMGQQFRVRATPEEISA